ncbi:uncharacterized protein MELLADRAFT_109941 [Melampsora larici-populina 98AG31]|uniref:Uncharacterized protein n=1 Tax=Melampsora larici-populina (strain 98AG31 / pathotype 3-4-7) TaxID=747676 RepID=F4RY47_MELLP|nr:uncharacterized protein MELLADRAFT_109941 [Melampsora larici-populina 98AG31]EGG02703.1 hypothetical protein MELLADRAFT_109941 [Melampsora larici-populina 98AG31]
MSSLPLNASPLAVEVAPVVEGLSSPFRVDLPNTLSSPYHVIDISPSPPPPVLMNALGQFDDAPSPEAAIASIDTTAAIASKLPDKIKSISSSRISSAPKIGLGLGIDTGGGSLISLADSAAAMAGGVGRGKLTSLIDRHVPLPLYKKSSSVYSRRKRSRRASPKEQGYLGEDEDDESDHPVSNYRLAGVVQRLNNDTHASTIASNHVQELIRNSLRQSAKEGIEPISKNFSNLKPSNKGPKRLSFEKNPSIEPIDKVLSPLVNPWQVYHAHSSALRSVIAKAAPRHAVQDIAEPASKLMRRLVLPRGDDESSSSANMLPIYPSDLSPNVTSSYTAPASYTSAISLASYTTSTPCAPTPTMTMAASSNIASATAIPSLSAYESPMLLPSSPHLALHSPNMANTPGSFSPSPVDTSVFPDAALNTPQPNDGGMNSGTGTLVLSLMAGGLGLCGIFVILFTILLKKNGGWLGVFNWKRKPRGTAYDEFIEEEKRWWVRETKMAKEQSRQSIYTAEEQSKDDISHATISGGMQQVNIARSASCAPSIPPIANIVDGKISMDSIRIELPCSSGSDCLSISSESSGELSNPSHDDHKFGNAASILSDMGIVRSSTDEMCQRMLPSVSPGRSRSESKSSILSKASKKSMSSLSSFFRLGLAANQVDPKFKLGAGISSDDINRLAREGRLDASELTKEKVGSLLNPGKMQISSPIMNDFTQTSIDLDEDSPVNKADPESRYNLPSAPVSVAKQPIIVSWTPPAILITDHPSELIPPSPPPPPAPRPISVGTTFTRFSTASYLSENATPVRDSITNYFPVVPSSPPPARDGVRNPTSRYESSIIDPEMLASLKRTSHPRRGSWKTFGGELANVETPLPPRTYSSSSNPRITSLSSLLNSRAQGTSTTHAGIFHSKIAASRFATPQRSSLSSIASSKTIRELAAVTEDLRALIDLDAEADDSWHAPTQFHKSVPDRVPRGSRAPPPIRPPKSVNRYNRIKNMSIEYESTSTPSSPVNPNMHFPSSSISSEHSYSSDWSLDMIRPPSKLYNRNGAHSRPVGIIEVNPSKVKSSNSGSSLATVISADSNTSLFEIASLHTAHTVRGASVEYVVRSPPQVASSRRSGPMMAIVEEMDEMSLSALSTSTESH